MAVIFFIFLVFSSECQNVVHPGRWMDYSILFDWIVSDLLICFFWLFPGIVFFCFPFIFHLKTYQNLSYIVPNTPKIPLQNSLEKSLNRLFIDLGVGGGVRFYPSSVRTSEKGSKCRKSLGVKRKIDVAPEIPRISYFLQWFRIFSYFLLYFPGFSY